MLTLYAGRKTATGCDGAPTLGFVSFTDEFGASWLRLDDAGGSGPRGDADKSGGGDSVQRFNVTDPGLKQARPECVMASVNELGNAANVYDTIGPFTLDGLPDLALRVKGVPRERLKLGQTRRIKITVTNTGDGTARGVKLTLAARRGVKSSPRVKQIGTLFAGRRKTITVKVRLAGGARSITYVPVTASVGKLKREAELKLLRAFKKSPPRRGGSGGSPSPDSPKLCTRFIPDFSGQSGGSLGLVPC